MMSNKRPLKSESFVEDEDKFYRLKILLPNGTTLTLALTNPNPEMSMTSFVNLVKEVYEKSRKDCEVFGKKRKLIDWDLAAQSYLEFNGEKIQEIVRFEMFKPDLCNIIRLDDGSGETSILYENMWDLTPDTELLKEIPQNSSFVAALANLIDNSLQAVWSCLHGDRRLISVDVLEDRISVFDSGPGMDSSSIDNWGKIGASVNTSHTIGGKPSYLMPLFGMFGYGGPCACIMGRRTLLSSKTKQSKKVFTLELSQETLSNNRSVTGQKWKADGGMRDPSEEEIKLSPHGSFTKVEIFESKCKIPEIYQLQCRLKDMYFPYIKCDDISKTEKTKRRVEFQINGEDLAEIAGGVVATTNLNSKGSVFWFQIRFTIQGTSQVANARLKFVYFPVVKGKERINKILESVEEEGYKFSENYHTFRRVFVRRLGRLLPEVPWASIPFMERGARASSLQKCCQRVICFVDLDAGFSPTPSKTDLASQNPFSVALENFGSESKDKDNDVSIVIYREGKCLGYRQVEQSYQDWVLEMHKTYDDKAASAEEAATDNKALCFSPDCKVNPGPLKCVVEQNPKALENLLPDSTVENYILQMFDGYDNHVAEGTTVLFCIDGFSVQDSMGLNRKVDSHGCVDLSGILKVTAGYGKSVSLSVRSDNEEIFKKESLIEKRELRLLTVLPESCTAGSNLANLIFKVTDSDGSMDTNIHYDENSKCYHTMTIESDSRSVESGIQYAFVYGSCKVPSLSLPESVGFFSFKVFHSRYPELHMSFKIQLTPAETFQKDETRCSTPYPRMLLTPESKMASTITPCVASTQQTPSSQLRLLNIWESPSALSSQTGLMDMVQYTENLKGKLSRYGDLKVEVDKRLNRLEAEKEQAGQELSNLQASLESLGAAFPECLSTKESVMKHVEEKHHNTAASVLCCLYKKSPQSLFSSKSGVVGFVALLGSVASTSLSRVLSEYLGEETMLALVCNSSRFGPNTTEYLRLKSEAARLGRSITQRFHVLCLEATRPWMDGVVGNDPQRKLAMDEPKLPNGDPIPGFKGYAVNLINLASEELNIRTNSGHGIRETLFYSIFGNLQVYETQKHVEAALPHINSGAAVSLDGFIVKENGYLYSECSKPEIHFPITVREDEEKKLRKMEAARDRVVMVTKKIGEEKCLLLKVEKKLKKTNGRYYNASHFLTLELMN